MSEGNGTSIKSLSPRRQKALAERSGGVMAEENGTIYKTWAPRGRKTVAVSSCYRYLLIVMVVAAILPILPFVSVGKTYQYSSTEVAKKEPLEKSTTTSSKSTMSQKDDAQKPWSRQDHYDIPLHNLMLHNPPMNP